MNLKRRSFIKGCAAAAAALGLSGGVDRPALASSGARPARKTLAGRLLAPFGAAPVPPKPAEPLTQAINQAVLSKLPFDDRQDYTDAFRGLVVPLPPEVQVIHNPYATPDRPLPDIWNLRAYDFLKEGAAPPDDQTVWLPAPPEANPSLWRQAQINLHHGLFEITPGIYQVRGVDMANITFIEGKKGIIIIDPVQNVEMAAAALKVYNDQRGQRPVTAVIYTHSHADHYGGVRGVITDEEVGSRKVPVIAPNGFLEKVISENVLAGTVMSRRSQYSYGIFLPRGPRGQVDAGLGKAIALGTSSLIAPTDIIAKTGERRKIDGIEIVFQMTPDAEAPAEMMMHFPQFRVLDAAEVACSLIHNIYTLRGAELRDATKWSFYLNEAIDLFGKDSDVVITSHNWPTWGNAAVIDYLQRQRDLYKYLHDQTLHLANQGYTMLEIAEELTRNPARNGLLPAGLDREWFCRSYYGSVSVNLKAIYNKYIGYYDCNPAHLEPLPPGKAAVRYVDFMGGADNVLARAQAAYANAGSVDDYRWVAEVMSHVVFADPANQAARNLAADALEQLGYQAESAIWRNQYLTGAFELRNGNQSLGKSTVSADAFHAMSAGSYFDYLGVRLNGDRAEGKTTVLNWVFTDTDEKYVLNLSNSALTYRADRQAAHADATLKLARSTLDWINAQPDAQHPALTPEKAFDAAIESGQVQVTGNRQKVHELLGDGGLLDTFATTFNIIEP
jgi:alkyl sulfatase BDS1-like metallo-beta-lactamase superfamily hydrolase